MEENVQIQAEALVETVESTVANAEDASHGSSHDGILSNTTFWVGIALIIFFAIVGKKVFGAITSGLDARAENIRKELEEARKLREDASVLLAEYQRKQRASEEEAENIVADAKVAADRIRAEAEKEVEVTLKRREEQAMEKIAQAEAAALSELRNLTVDAAMKASEALIKEKMDAKAGNKLIDDAIKDLSTKLN